MNVQLIMVSIQYSSRIGQDTLPQKKPIGLGIQGLHYNVHALWEV